MLDVLQVVSASLLYNIEVEPYVAEAMGLDGVCTSYESQYAKDINSNSCGCRSWFS
jgi:hypothetical protein